MKVQVTGVRPSGMFDTVITFTGIDVDTGNNVVFAVDHRPARDLREAEIVFGFAKAIQVDHLTNDQLDTIEAIFQSAAEREADRASGRDS